VHGGAYYLQESDGIFLQVGTHYLYARKRILCKAMQMKSKLVHTACVKRDRIFLKINPEHDSDNFNLMKTIMPS